LKQDASIRFFGEQWFPAINELPANSELPDNRGFALQLQGEKAPLRGPRGFFLRMVPGSRSQPSRLFFATFAVKSFLTRTNDSPQYRLARVIDFSS